MHENKGQIAPCIDSPRDSPFYFSVKDNPVLYRKGRNPHQTVMLARKGFSAIIAAVNRLSNIFCSVKYGPADFHTVFSVVDQSGSS